ncbi:TIGR04255 family protein [Taklimakanibacter lacteus]|uniref:TIGR04255 family protein n=1 Tax=Taklimakanibacter lacteus TaxID=2268456 RepID=UPI0013C49E1F
MTFKPATEKHAIIEAVFGLLYARQFTAKEIEAAVAVHQQQWPELPRLNRTQVLQVQMGEGPLPDQASMPPLVAGVSFDRVKPDGKLGWRLRLDEAKIIVNCLDYVSWSEVWPKAWDYFERASEALQSRNNPIKGAFLQYVDVFEWLGNQKDYSVDKLLRRGSPYVPASVFQSGTAWHLHQGRYIEDGLPVKGRLLQRIHLDAGTSRQPSTFVKIDSYLNLDFADPMIVRGSLKEKKDRLGPIFEFLHDMDKRILRDYLTPELAKDIGLT